MNRYTIAFPVSEELFHNDDMPPHMTLFYLRSNARETHICGAVEDISKKHKKIYVHNEGDNDTQFSGKEVIVYNSTKELILLQRDIVNALLSYVDEKKQKKDFDKLSPQQEKNLLETGNPYIGVDYSPHVTGRPVDSEKLKTLKLDTLAVFKNRRNLIAEFSLL